MGSYVRTPEIRAKNSAAAMGKHHTEEAKARIRAARALQTNVQVRHVPIGSTCDVNGYVWIKIAEPNVWDMEHRAVMGAEKGDGMVVHHGPGGKKDNRPENLTLFESVAAHMTHHHAARRRLRLGEGA